MGGPAASPPARVASPSPVARRLPGPLGTPDFEVEDALPPWGMVPRAVFADPRVSPVACKLYGLLATFANRTSREAFPKHKALAQSLGSERTVGRAARELDRFGYVRVRKIKGSDGRFVRTVYKLLGWEPVDATSHRPSVSGGDHRPIPAPVHRTEMAGLTTTDQRTTPTDQTTPVPSAPPTVSIREMVDALYNGIANASGVTKLVNFNGGLASSLFSKAVKAGDDAKLLRGIILRFVHAGRNLTVPSFASQFDTLRGEVLMGRQMQQRTNGRLAGGGLASSDDHAR